MGAELAVLKRFYYDIALSASLRHCPACWGGRPRPHHLGQRLPVRPPPRLPAAIDRGNGEKLFPA